MKLFGWRRRQPGAGLGVSPRRSRPPWRCGVSARLGDSLAQRNPMLLFRLSGVLLLRFAARRLIGLLFHDPPRRTVAHPRIAAPRGRWCPCRLGDPTLPAANEPPELVDQPGGVFVLVHAEEAKLARQPKVGAERGQLTIGIGKGGLPLVEGAEQRAVQGERRLFDLPREDEPLLAREPRRRRQEPLEQVIRLRERRRPGRHRAAEKTKRARSASRRRYVWPWDACATQLCTDAVTRAAGSARSAKAR